MVRSSIDAVGSADAETGALKERQVHASLAVNFPDCSCTDKSLKSMFEVVLKQCMLPSQTGTGWHTDVKTS